MENPKLDAILERTGVSRRSLVGILHAVQEEYRCLPRTVLEAIDERLGASSAEIVSVASFCLQFRFQPARCQGSGGGGVNQG